MSLLALDSRWRRFNDPDRRCPCCGRRFSGIFDIGFAAPDAWPHPPRADQSDLVVGTDRLTSEFCRIGQSYFLRGVMVFPLRGTDEGFSFGPWAEVSKPVFDACLDAIANPDHAFPPAEGLLANELPGFAEAFGTVLNLGLPDPAQRPLLRALDGPLSSAQADGLTFDSLLDIYADFGDDLRPHLTSD